MAVVEVVTRPGGSGGTAVVRRRVYLASGEVLADMESSPLPGGAGCAPAAGWLVMVGAPGLRLAGPAADGGGGLVCLHLSVPGLALERLVRPPPPSMAAALTPPSTIPPNPLPFFTAGAAPRRFGCGLRLGTPGTTRTRPLPCPTTRSSAGSAGTM